MPFKLQFSFYLLLLQKQVNIDIISTAQTIPLESSCQWTYLILLSAANKWMKDLLKCVVYEENIWRVFVLYHSSSCEQFKKATFWLLFLLFYSSGDKA